MRAWSNTSPYDYLSIFSKYTELFWVLDQNVVPKPTNEEEETATGHWECPTSGPVLLRPHDASSPLPHSGSPNGTPKPSGTEPSSEPFPTPCKPIQPCSAYNLFRKQCPSFDPGTLRTPPDLNRGSWNPKPSPRTCNRRFPTAWGTSKVTFPSCAWTERNIWPFQFASASRNERHPPQLDLEQSGFGVDLSADLEHAPRDEFQQHGVVRPTQIRSVTCRFIKTKTVMINHHFANISEPNSCAKTFNTSTQNSINSKPV